MASRDRPPQWTSAPRYCEVQSKVAPHQQSQLVDRLQQSFDEIARHALPQIFYPRMRFSVYLRLALPQPERQATHRLQIGVAEIEGNQPKGPYQVTFEGNVHADYTPLVQ
jgi:hypothetical protein